MKKTRSNSPKPNDAEKIRKNTEKFLKTLEELKPFLKKKIQRVYSNTRQWETINSDVS